MNRIDRSLSYLRKTDRRGLIAYLTAGDPDLETSLELVLEMVRCGADMIELGVPFSDPVADGPVIQAASMRALENGVTIAKVLDLAGQLRKKTGIPLLIMTYFNPIYAYGVDNFVEAAQKKGIDGLIIPDMPLEESEELAGALENAGLHFIHLLAPTSSEKRIEATVRRAKGFIYCVSVAGVTGARETVPEAGLELLSCVRSKTDLPLALGFGISKPEQVAALNGAVDAVVMGSAIVRLIEEGGTGEEIKERIGNFFSRFR
ncbi:MAG TPA: tryptophan synthase subunit alpha [Firmicutes bacterium]|nr:tryptophan synthase subunit alpha [Bacillota bacterium]